MGVLNIYLTKIFKNMPEDVICNILKYTNIIYIKERNLFIGKINNIVQKYYLLYTIPRPTITVINRGYSYYLHEIFNYALDEMQNNVTINNDLINYYIKLGFTYKKRIPESSLSWRQIQAATTSDGSILPYYDVIIDDYEEHDSVYGNPKEYILNVNMCKTIVKYRTHINKVIDEDGWITEEKISTPVYHKVPFKIVKAVSGDKIKVKRKPPSPYWKYITIVNNINYAVISSEENIGHEIPEW